MKTMYLEFEMLSCQTVLFGFSGISHSTTPHSRRRETVSPVSSRISRTVEGRDGLPRLHVATGERQPAPWVRGLRQAPLDEDAPRGDILNHAHVAKCCVHWVSSASPVKNAPIPVLVRAAPFNTMEFRTQPFHISSYRVAVFVDCQRQFVIGYLGSPAYLCQHKARIYRRTNRRFIFSIFSFSNLFHC